MPPPQSYDENSSKKLGSLENKEANKKPMILTENVSVDLGSTSETAMMENKSEDVSKVVETGLAHQTKGNGSPTNLRSVNEVQDSQVGDMEGIETQTDCFKSPSLKEVVSTRSKKMRKWKRNARSNAFQKTIGKVPSPIRQKMIMSHMEKSPRKGSPSSIHASPTYSRASNLSPCKGDGGKEVDIEKSARRKVVFAS
ncbi:hypothetical protein Q3G72_027277 [Acer saccharum]|nr:hypothetical protein Q3G72_027277 [Acer saccharum]